MCYRILGVVSDIFHDAIELVLDVSDVGVDVKGASRWNKK